VSTLAPRLDLNDAGPSLTVYSPVDRAISKAAKHASCLRPRLCGFVTQANASGCRWVLLIVVGRLLPQNAPRNTQGVAQFPSWIWVHLSASDYLIQSGFERLHESSQDPADAAVRKRIRGSQKRTAEDHRDVASRHWLVSPTASALIKAQFLRVAHHSPPVCQILPIWPFSASDLPYDGIYRVCLSLGAVFTSSSLCDWMRTPRLT